MTGWRVTLPSSVTATEVAGGGADAPDVHLRGRANPVRAGGRSAARLKVEYFSTRAGATN